MAKRSLKASAIGQARAKQALDRKGWTQEYLATAAGLSTRNSVWKFLSGRPVERYIFTELCFQLDLEWEEIADLPGQETPLPDREPSPAPLDLETCYLATKSKLRHQFYQQWATVQSSFNITQQFALENLYTDLQLLPHLRHQQWLEADDLQRALLQGDAKGTLRARQTLVSTPRLKVKEAIEHHPKLVILGKPGSGKTTLLKYLTLQCFNSQLYPDCIPLFIPLRDWGRLQREQADLSLLAYVQTLLAEASPSAQTQWLTQGRLWLIFDALDEMPRRESERFLQQIQQLGQDYPDLPMVITSRIAAQTYFFPGFTYLEIANFQPDQIEAYAHHWFGEGAKAQALLDHLARPEHQSIVELAKTPLLMELICCAFQERSQLPRKPSKLYKEGLKALLNRGSRSQAFQTDYGYNDLTLPEKIALLGAIAAQMFQRGCFYFDKDAVLPIIRQYLLQNQTPPPDPDSLWFRSEAILRAIQVQHGLLVEQAKEVYSFSHVTFQEYLTAQHWAALGNGADFIGKGPQLLQRLGDPHWQEVIRLTLSMTPSPDEFIQDLKARLDGFWDGDRLFQAIHQQLVLKSQVLRSGYSPVAIRALYLGMGYVKDLNLATSLDPTIGQSLDPEITLDLQLIRIGAIGETLSHRPDFDECLNLVFALDIERRFTFTPYLQSALHQCKAQLPSFTPSKGALEDWWRTHGQSWCETFTQTILAPRSLGISSPLSPAQSLRLRQYYDGLLFLLTCLEDDSPLSPAVAQAIREDIIPAYRPFAVNYD